MHADLLLTKELVYDVCHYPLSSFNEEAESSDYGGCTFALNERSVKFRVAKITPTKVGHFVTLWKRDSRGTTCPHNSFDAIDLYVISVRKDNFFGQFVFPKSALIKQGILSTVEKEGKRGFRVYPVWDVTDNKQARKTQKWQSEFFLEVIDANTLNVDQVKSLYSN